MRRILILTLAAGIVLAGVACSKKTEVAPPSKSSGGSAAAQSPSPVPTGPPGSYSYGSYGLTAEMKPNPPGSNTYDLSVTNKTGSTGKPGIYALDARTGKRIEATVAPDEAVQDGQTKDYTVTMGTGFDAKQIGLMIILLGGKNFGAFVANTSP
jgi:hypothetical protein